MLQLRLIYYAYKNVQRMNFFTSQDIKSSLSPLPLPSVPSIPLPPSQHTAKFQGSTLPLVSKLFHSVECIDALFLFFIKPSNILTLMQCSKHCYKANTSLCKDIFSSKDPLTAIAADQTMTVGVGTGNGALVLFKCSDLEAVIVQVDTKAVRSIAIHNQYVYVAVEGFTIHVLAKQSKTVVMVCRPNIVSCEAVMGIQIRGEYLLQTSKEGYIVLWDVYKGRNSNTNAKCPKQYNVFPKLINHSICTQGFLWIGFYGFLIAAITKKGEFKLVALSLQNKDEFIIVMRYEIPNGSAITHAETYPLEQCVIVSLNVNNCSMLYKLQLSNKLRVESITEMRVKEVPFIKSFKLYDRILVCRGDKEVVIGHCELLKNRAKEQSKEEEPYNYTQY